MKRSRIKWLIGLSCMLFLMTTLLGLAFPPGAQPVAAGSTPTPISTSMVTPTDPPPSSTPTATVTVLLLPESTSEAAPYVFPTLGLGCFLLLAFGRCG